MVFSLNARVLISPSCSTQIKRKPRNCFALASFDSPPSKSGIFPAVANFRPSPAIKHIKGGADFHRRIPNLISSVCSCFWFPCVAGRGDRDRDRTAGTNWAGKYIIYCDVLTARNRVGCGRFMSHLSGRRSAGEQIWRAQNLQMWAKFTGVPCEIRRRRRCSGSAHPELPGTRSARIDGELSGWWIVFTQQTAHLG